MHFRDTDFRRAAGIFEASHGRRTRAAGIAGNVDDICPRLGDADRNGADAFRRDELDDDAHARRLGIVDKLGQILDRIGIVMRRRRNEFDARRATARRRDFHRHLGRRQLSALTRLCALTDLDLDLFQHRIGKITGPDTEAAGGELLDARGTDGAVTGDMLAALARIRHAADHVCAMRHRLMGGRDQRAMAHRTRRQRLGDLARLLHRIERNARRRGADKREVGGGLTPRLDHERAAFQPMAGNIVTEAVEQRLAECGKAGKFVTMRTGQLQPKRAVSRLFAAQSAHHEAVVALPGEATHFPAEFFGRTGKGHISRQFQNIAQGGRTSRPFLRHHAGKGTVTGCHLERVDGLRGQSVEAVVIIGRIVEPEGILKPIERQKTQRLLVFGSLVETDLFLRHVHETAYRRRAIGMAGTFRTFLEEAEQRNVVLTLHRQRLAVPVRHRLRDDGEVDTTDRGFHIGEITLQHRIVGIEEVRLEKFAADVAFRRTQADLAHCLHQRLFSRLGEALEGLVGIGPEFLLRTELHAEWVDRRSAEAEAGCDMMGGRKLSAFDDQGNAQP
ncbi:hypothetical protein D3C80_815580 [compost metagenome]